MSITGAACSGMQNAQARLERTAERIAGSAATPSDSEDLGNDIVDLLSAREQFAANARVIQTADEMRKKVIDLLA